jgi:hypothetical protein
MAPSPSKPLTKSLHTVTVVSRLASGLMERSERYTPSEACREALGMIGQPAYTSSDETFDACVTATKKLRGLK